MSIKRDLINHLIFRHTDAKVISGSDVLHDKLALRSELDARNGEILCLRARVAVLEKVLDGGHRCMKRAGGFWNCEYAGCCVDGTCCTCCYILDETREVFERLGYRLDGSLLYCSPGCQAGQADCAGGECPNA